MDRLISEQQVLKVLDNLKANFTCYDSVTLDEVASHVKAIPPAEPKTGHWIVHPKGIYAHLICDKCLSNAPYDCRTDYCPNCGCRMVEPQEISDRNLKMWKDIYEEEKRRTESEDKE